MRYNLPLWYLRTFSNTVKALFTTSVLKDSASVIVGKIKGLNFDKIFYSSIDSVKNEDFGCYFAPFKTNGVINTSVIELGEFEISDPSIIKGFKISSEGRVNDNWALAIGSNNPEKIIYQIPNSLINQDFYINTETSNTISLKKFKLYLIVHQYYRTLTPDEFIERANNSPMATVDEVQSAMSSECSANDPFTTSFTDGFYANFFKVEMIFN